MDRVLLIVNTYAGSFSPRRKEVIAKALAADFKLEVADTESRDHASELATDAVDRGFDAVLAFGGDGTINEVAQALVTTDTALGILPGGSTNVQARTLGVPLDPVEAAAYVAGHLRSRTTRRINVGRLDERYFVAGAGMGLDAEVVKRVELERATKGKWGEWVFVKHALAAGITQYRAADPTIRLTVDGAEPIPAILVVCGNLRPLTYFKGHPVDACPQAALDAKLDFVSFRKLPLRSVPRLVYALFVSRSHIRWRTVDYVHDVTAATIEADRPLPTQVDGDYIGDRTSVRIQSVPEALTMLV